MDGAGDGPEERAPGPSGRRSSRSVLGELVAQAFAHGAEVPEARLEPLLVFGRAEGEAVRRRAGGDVIVPPVLEGGELPELLQVVHDVVVDVLPEVLEAGARPDGAELGVDVVEGGERRLVRPSPRWRLACGHGEATALPDEDVGLVRVLVGDEGGEGGVLLGELVFFEDPASVRLAVRVRFVEGVNLH